MLKLNLVLLRRGKDIVILTLSLWFRIIFIVIAIIILSGIFFSSAGNTGKNAVVPVIISVICIIAAHYEESWIFDRGKKIIHRKTGLVFFNKKRSFTFPEIESIELMVMLRGGPKISAEKQGDESTTKREKFVAKKYYQELRLNLKSGESSTVETFEGYNINNLKKKTLLISEFCGLPLAE